MSNILNWLQYFLSLVNCIITLYDLTLQIHHPFAVKPTQPTYVQQPTLVYHNNAWKTSNQLAIEADAAKPLVEKFPVSAGIQHTRENPAGSDNVFDQYKVQCKCRSGRTFDKVISIFGKRLRDG